MGKNGSKHGTGATSTSVGPFPDSWLAARMADLTSDLQWIIKQDYEKNMKSLETGASLLFLQQHMDECFLVNDHINRALEDQLWKKSKTGFNLANYNMNHSLSELSICLEEKQDNKDKEKDSNVPLKVELPPMKTDNEASKVFMFDQSEEKEKGEKEQAESRLNIEEFECGVHFGGGENSKQEWSFTLYDFDGHGKITKEDLAGLLKALYDAVGSSIKIPNNGTKTLKLRLTVGQDGALGQGQGTEAAQVTTDKNEKDSPKKKDLLKNKDIVKHKDSPKAKKKDITKLNNLTSSQTAPAKCNNETAGQPSSVATRSRLSTKEHQELAELVQENMERNHIKQLRRHHSDCRGCHFEHPHQKRRQKGPRTLNSSKPNNNSSVSKNTNKNASDSVTVTKNNNPDLEDKPKESQDRRNYYLDLAGIENNTSKFQSAPQTTNSTKTALTTELNNASKFQPIKTSSALPAEKLNSSKHFRSRSHESNDKKCDNVRFESEQCQNQAESHLRSRSFDPQDSSKANVRSQKGNPLCAGHKPMRYRPVSLPAHVPEAISPHYHRRHRHREKDHNMAMQQVAEWIEREHTIDMEGDRIVIQRHEHHHVHEHHHHHHYHHYYEA